MKSAKQVDPPKIPQRIVLAPLPVEHGGGTKGAMPFHVCAGALTQCSFGVAPGALSVLPAGRPLIPTPAATIADCAPMVNLSGYGSCSSMANPMVAAATAAALGALTPQPCLPVPAGTWAPPAVKTFVGGVPALHNNAKLMCAWGGVIQVVYSGQVVVQCE